MSASYRLDPNRFLQIQDEIRTAEADLAAGVPNEDANGATDSGLSNVIYGSSTGLTSTSNQKWQQGTNGIPGTTGDADQFGFDVA